MSRSRGHQWPRGPKNALHVAARDGCMGRTVDLLSSGSFDIDQGDLQGFTPLMCAALRGHTSVTRILLNRGANVFIAQDGGCTALYLSVQQGHLDTTKLLVNAGSDLDVREKRGMTPLYRAAFQGNAVVAQILIEAGANPDNGGPSETTPLWVAARNGHKDMVTMLLRAKANPLLAADFEGRSCHTVILTGERASLPLDVAAHSGLKDVVFELILQVGIEGCSASGGVDALCLAAECEHVGVMAVLTDAGVVDTGQALCVAASNGREGSVSFLLQEQQRKRWVTSCRGGYVHATDPYDRTPLVCSIDACSPRVVRLLLDAGADTTMGVRVSHKVGAAACNETPLACTVDFIDELTADGKDANEEKLHKLEAIRRMLLQGNAVHAASWLWPRDIASACANGAERTKRTKKTPAAGTPLKLMLPILHRRARRRGVLLAALGRYSAKSSDEPATE